MGKQSREKHTGLTAMERQNSPKKANPDTSASHSMKKRMRMRQRRYSGRDLGYVF